MPFPSVTPLLTITDQKTSYFVEDTTVYSSPARGDLGLFLMFVNIKTTGPVYYLANLYNAISADEFTFINILKDGNYTLFYWAVHKKTGLETPALNDFVYNDVTTNFERWDGAAWVIATPADFYTLAASSATVLNNKHHPDFKKALDYLNRAFATGSPVFTQEQLRPMIIELDIYLKGAVLAFEAAPAEYQRAIEGYYPTVNMINGATSP